MALREKKAEAIRMREGGATYTEIKEQLRVSKSTLSLWLRGMPLSKERMDQVRGKNPLRIERYRETRRIQKQARLDSVRNVAAKRLGTLSDREIFLAGLFLYWGEGGKTKDTSVILSNTDPSMLVFYIKWLQTLGVSKDRLKIRINLYSDMDKKKEFTYWSKILAIPISQFRKPYMKKSRRSDITYTQKFIHGTCNVIYENRDISELVLQSLSEIQERFAE